MNKDIKIFVVVLAVAGAIGGVIGGYFLGNAFSVIWAVLVPIMLGTILLVMGAYFSKQGEKERKNRPFSPHVNDLLNRSIPGREEAERRKGYSHNENALLNTIGDIINSDRDAVKRGEVPERRLIPHHAIKRDVIICAYTKDCNLSTEQIKNMSWTQQEKERRLTEIKNDFTGKINGIKQLGADDLDKIISLMRKTRTDLYEIEQEVRSKNPIYGIVKEI